MRLEDGLAVIRDRECGTQAEPETQECSKEDEESIHREIHRGSELVRQTLGELMCCTDTLSSRLGQSSVRRFYHCALR